MRQFVLMLALGLGLIVLPQNTFAQEGHDHMDHAGMEQMRMEPVSVSTDADQAAETAPLEEVGNPLCPVSGEKVGEMGEIVKYEHRGKIYNFCCEACIKDFKKDPEKYSKIAEDEVKAHGAVEMSDLEKMGHDHKSSHEGHPRHDHTEHQHDRGYQNESQACFDRYRDGDRPVCLRLYAFNRWTRSFQP